MARFARTCGFSLNNPRMNRTEERYASLLETRRLAGELLRWEFEPCAWRLGHHCFYHVDFMVITASLEVEWHEVKGGFVRDDGRAKFEAAAARFPWFRWVLAKWSRKRGWVFEERGGFEGRE